MKESKTNEMINKAKSDVIDVWAELQRAIGSKEMRNFLYIEEKDARATAYAKSLREKIAKALNAMDELTSTLDRAPEL